MKIISLAIIRKDANGGEPTCLASAYELSQFGFFQRGTVKEMLGFVGKTFVKQTQPNVRQSIKHEGYVGHVYVAGSGLSGVIFCDGEYPPRVAFGILNKMMEDFSAQYQPDQWGSAPENGVPFPRLEEALVQYQNPADADKITQIQKELDETKIVLHQTIDSVLERGQRLDDLVAKSGDLSASSKTFYKTAKKQNQCCQFM